MANEEYKPVASSRTLASQDPKTITGLVLWIALLGLCTSFIFLKLTALPMKWQLLLPVGLTLAFIAVLLRSLDAAFFGLLVLTLPFRIDQILVSFPYVGGSSGLRIALIDVILLVLLANGLRKRAQGQAKQMDLVPSVSIAWLFFFFVAVLSFIGSDFPLSGLGLIIEMVRCFLAFALVVNYFTTRDRVRRALMLLALGVGIQGLIALMQYQSQHLIERLGVLGQSEEVYQASWQRAGQIRPGGTLGGPNDLAYYFVLVLPCVAVFVLSTGSWPTRFVTMVALALGLAGLVVTGSRMGWISSGIGFGILGLLASRTSARRNILLAWLLIAILIASVLWFSSDLIRQRLFSHDYDAAYSRIPMMVDSLHMIQANPILGVGINNYAASVAPCDVTGVYREWGEFHPVHNAVLLHFAETGLIGGLLFCTLWAVCLLNVLRCLRCRDPFAFLMAAGTSAGMLGLIVWYQAQWGYLEAHLPFVVVLGLCIGASKIDARKTRRFGAHPFLD